MLDMYLSCKGLFVYCIFFVIYFEYNGINYSQAKLLGELFPKKYMGDFVLLYDIVSKKWYVYLCAGYLFITNKIG